MVCDEQLVRQILKGDKEAFSEIVTYHQKKVYNIAYRLTGNHDDASDAAQEAFIKAYKALHTFRQDAKLSTWLYRITVNVCYDLLRRKKKEKVISIDQANEEYSKVYLEIEDHRAGPADQLTQKELRMEIDSAIQDLPEEQRTIMVLRDINGFSYQEISEMTQLPMGTIKSRLNRARLKVARKLQTTQELLPLSLRLKK